MVKPTSEQLAVAIEWLDANEGDPDGERAACVAVAIYLEKLLDRRMAREGGITVSYLRRLRGEYPAA